MPRTNPQLAGDPGSAPRSGPWPSETRLVVRRRLRKCHERSTGESESAPAIAATPARATATPACWARRQALAEQDVGEQDGARRGRASRARRRGRAAHGPLANAKSAFAVDVGEADRGDRRSDGRGNAKRRAPRVEAMTTSSVSDPTRAPNSVESASPWRLPSPRK